MSQTYVHPVFHHQTAGGNKINNKNTSNQWWEPRADSKRLKFRPQSLKDINLAGAGARNRAKIAKRVPAALGIIIMITYFQFQPLHETWGVGSLIRFD